MICIILYGPWKKQLLYITTTTEKPNKEQTAIAFESYRYKKEKMYKYIHIHMMFTI